MTSQTSPNIQYPDTLASQAVKFTPDLCMASVMPHLEPMGEQCVHTDTTISVDLIMAKSKVAPIKAQTIPRLELCGAQLLSKLLSQMSADLAVPVEAIFAWTDLAVVLGWLKMPANRLKVFVTHRVAEMISRVDVDHWRYVSTHLNPADLISRGVMPAALTENSLWWSASRLHTGLGGPTSTESRSCQTSSLLCS